MAITVGGSGNRITGDSDYGIQVNNSTEVERLYTNYLKGNSNNPAFIYHGNGGWRYFTANTWNEMNGTRMGTWQGSQRGAGGYGFNTSEGRYYAPVSGYYYFHCDFYVLCDNNTTNNYIHLLFGRNNNSGWAVGGRTPYIIHGHGNRRGVGSDYPHGPNISAVMYLSQGQYCNIRIYKANSSTVRYHGNHSFWTGHLID